ncbi:kinase-like domain-containing protein [Cyathus striatus]|nr:kinase-like domain-containing protein [Cyathus striatus]
MKEKCELLEWIAEGGRNQIYLAHLSNGNQVAARVTFPYSYCELHGPEFVEQDDIDWSKNPTRMGSEFQTIEYLRNKTKLPIPAIFTINITESPIGAPYTIQEFVGGTAVVHRWFGISRVQKLAIIQKLAEFTGILYSLKFDSYGSITDGKLGTVGAFIEPPYCLHHPYPPLGMVGPWPKEDPFGIFVSFATRECHWLKSDLGKRLFFKYYDGRNGPDISAEQAWETSVKISEELLSLIPHLSTLYPLPPLALRPTLAHPDYHFNNVLVSESDPSVITGIVDWEYAAVLPLWYTHSMVQDIEYVGDQVYDNPNFSKEEEDMLREEYTKAISRIFPEFELFVSDALIQKKTVALHSIISIAGKGDLVDFPMSMMKAKLEFARGEAHCDNNPGIEILDRIIKLMSA